MRFEFWTCGTFDADASKLLREAQQNIRKYQVAWRDGDSIRQYAGGIKESGIVKILNEHYFNHPLADLSAVGVIEQGGEHERADLARNL
jgi:hypothetical protein